MAKNVGWGAWMEDPAFKRMPKAARRLRDVRISLVQLPESPSLGIGHAQHTAEQLLDGGGAPDL